MATYYASSNFETINGTDTADFIYGNNESHSGTYYDLTLKGNGGDDTINVENASGSNVYGGDGNDILLAGTSNATYFWGGSGNDSIYGESSNTDWFFAEAGDDVIYAGNASGSLFFGGDGHNVFYGGVSAGSVTYAAGNGGDEIHAGDVADPNASFLANGGSGADTFFGENVQGNIKFNGGAGDDVYYGGGAKSIVIADSSGTDELHLSYGYGAYTFTLDDSGSIVGMVDASANQTITFSGIEDFYFTYEGGVYHYTYDQLGHLFFATGDSQTLQGTSSHDQIFGTNESYDATYSNLTLYGAGGDDVIYGVKMVNSTAYGGEGNDDMEGYTSSYSVFFGGEGADNLSAFESSHNTFYGDAGNDTLNADLSIESVFYGGSGANSFYGDNAKVSVSYYGGNDGDIVHAGRLGDTSTTLDAHGGTASDTFYADDAQGIVTFTDAGGNDAYYGGTATDVSIADGGGTDSLYLDYGLSQYTITADASADSIQLVANGVTQTINATGIEDFYFKTGDGGWDHYTYEELACFLAGTLIRTPEGEVAIETLKAGDLVLTTAGEAKPVLWVGRRAVATRFAHPLTALPIHIRPDALGRGLPARDLFVSPDHAFFMGGLLVQAGALVNGVTITRHHDLPETFTYYHVELEDHDLIYAEALPAETFIDNLERDTFDNAADFPGRSRPAVELDLPRVKSRRQLPKVLARALGEWAARAVPRVA